MFLFCDAHANIHKHKVYSLLWHFYHDSYGSNQIFQVIPQKTTPQANLIQTNWFELLLNFVYCKSRLRSAVKSCCRGFWVIMYKTNKTCILLLCFWSMWNDGAMLLKTSQHKSAQFFLEGHSYLCYRNVSVVIFILKDTYFLSEIYLSDCTVVEFSFIDQILSFGV